MGIIAWDEPHGFTDVDLGITDADMVGEMVSVSVWHNGTERDGTQSWAWELWIDHVEWEEVIEGGLCETAAIAEQAGEAARENYLRSLNRK